MQKRQKKRFIHIAGNIFHNTDLKQTNKEMNDMIKFECFVRRDRITKKIIRFFISQKYAFAWLELEGYKVLSIKQLS